MARHSERSGEGERELRYPAIAVRSEVIGAWSIESLIVTAAPNLFAFLTAASVRLVLPSQPGPSRLPRSPAFAGQFRVESRDRSHLIGID
jgi:hypothetical protein